jgi:organic radical activating enzyme
LNPLHIDWKITNVCNFKCTYCDPILNTGKTQLLSSEDVLAFLKQIKRPIKLELTGGEPTSFKGIEDILNYTCSKSITTNGSKSIKWWEENIDKLDSVIISYHHNVSNLDHLLKIAKIKRKAHLHFSVLMNLENFYEIYDIAVNLQEFADTVHLLPIRSPLPNLNKSNLIRYSKDQLEHMLEQEKHFKTKFKSLDFYLDMIKGNNYIGKKCGMGKDYIVIDECGNIKNAWCTHSVIGNIKNDLVLSSEYFTCDKIVCPCIPGQMPT